MHPFAGKNVAIFCNSEREFRFFCEKNGLPPSGHGWGAGVCGVEDLVGRRFDCFLILPRFVPWRRFAQDVYDCFSGTELDRILSFFARHYQEINNERSDY